MGRWYNVWSGNCVLDVHHKCTFGPDPYFESGPKVHVQTIWKWTQRPIWHAIINNEKRLFLRKNLSKWPNYSNVHGFLSKILGQKWLWGAYQTHDNEFLRIIFWRNNYTPANLLSCSVHNKNIEACWKNDHQIGCWYLSTQSKENFQVSDWDDYDVDDHHGDCCKSIVKKVWNISGISVWKSVQENWFPEDKTK